MSICLGTHSACHLCVDHSYDAQLPPTSIEHRSELSGLIVHDLLGYDFTDLKVFCVDAADWEQKIRREV